jgi:ABC-type antimicrobial peptide transport system permease subunit
MEQEYFLELISENLDNETLSMFPDFPMILKNQKISDFANTVILNFPKPRIDSYLVSNMDDLQYKGVSFANKVIETLGEDGRDNLKLDMPVIEKMKPLFYGSIFLGLILNVIIIILFTLSLILIHSLLVITTETNTFQLGLLRMLGTTKSGVIKIIVFQCLSFSIPACILAYSVHFYVLDGISLILSKFTDNSTHLSQNFNSIIFAFIVCNLAPLIAAILPIRSLLNKNLAFTISSSSSKSSGVHIEIISAGERERSTLVTFGVLTFLYGASIYYFLPLSLLSINLTLLLAIFLWILLGMLLGFIVLSLNVENILQKIFTYVFLFWTKSHTKIMIIKNLTTHRIRNRQTSMMYALSVGFFIMITVGLDIELKSLTLTQLLKRGSYAHLERGGEYYIKPQEIKNSLKLMLEKEYITDYTFISANLRDVCFSSENTFMNIGKSMDFRVDVVSISPNFYEAAEKVFLIVEQEKIENKENSLKMKSWPLSEKMYHSSNEGRIGVSGIFNWEIGLNVEDNFYLNTMKDSNVMPLIFKPSFILHSSPALKMSAVPSTMYQRSVILPMHTYLDILNKCWAYFIKSPEDIKTFSYEEFPIDRILLKLNPNIDSQIATKGIQQIIEDDPNYLVRSWYYSDQEKNINKISAICNVIFYGVSIVVLIFCFFNLTASMTINIYEQKKEIAILRSLGMTSNHILFVYICESFILIFVSSFIGLIIGSIISWTMTMQRVIFTNLPLHFNFPYGQLFFIFMASTISGFLSTIVPAKAMLRNSISNLIRN